MRKLLGMRPIGNIIERVVRNIGPLIKKRLRLNLYPTKPTDQPFALKFTGIAFLQRTWIQIKIESRIKAVFVLVKRNFKVYATIGLKVRSKKRFVVIFVSWAGSRFISLNENPQAMPHNIRKNDSSLNIRNASGKASPIVVTIYLIVQIGKSTEIVASLIAEPLTASVILRCDFFIDM